MDAAQPSGLDAYSSLQLLKDRVENQKAQQRLQRSPMAVGEDASFGNVWQAPQNLQLPNNQNVMFGTTTVGGTQSWQPQTIGAIQPATSYSYSSLTSK